jgi:hypothetical protein
MKFSVEAMRAKMVLSFKRSIALVPMMVMRRTKNQHPINAGDRGNQPFMLAENVEFVQGPNGVIPSFVRFESFDRSSFALGKPLFAFNAIDSSERVDHTMQRIEDWEMPIAIRFFAIALGEGSGEQVQAATERVKNGADPSIHGKRQRNSLLSYKQIAACLRVTLFDDAIGATLLPLNKSLLQQWGLGYGPIDASLGV